MCVCVCDCGCGDDGTFSISQLDLCALFFLLCFNGLAKTKLRYD